MIDKKSIKLINGDVAIILDSNNYKALKSKEYNFFFDKKTGYFVRWGFGNEQPEKITNKEIELYVLWCNIWGEKFDFKQFLSDLKTDGSFENTAVEIVDWEISELCDANCGFCYKSNVNYKGKNISFDDFKKTFEKLPASVTTIAYGIGSVSLCPDLFKILNYTRNHGIIPTITINGFATNDELDKLSKVVGACAVSVYDKNRSYDCIKRLTDNGLEQCNIHALICEETYEKTLEILNDIKTDSRLSKLRAIIMLSLKEKGRSIGKYHKLSQEKFDTLFKFAIDNNIGFGFDSCSAAKALDFVNRFPEYNYMKTYIEPCEAGGKYSSYINVNSDYFPCSFAEGHNDWKTGLSVSNCEDFMKDIWFNEKNRKFGEGVKKCRECNIGCSIYDV
jgi:hypothetical protein